MSDLRTLQGEVLRLKVRDFWINLAASVVTGGVGIAAAVQPFIFITDWAMSACAIVAALVLLAFAALSFEQVIRIWRSF